ncbi:MAG: transposase [Shewanella sp.]
MKINTKPTYNAEFRLEASQLVLDQGYTIRETHEADSSTQIL